MLENKELQGNNKKLTFKKHICDILFADVIKYLAMMVQCSNAFAILPCFEYCSPGALKLIQFQAVRLCPE